MIGATTYRWCMWHLRQISQTENQDYDTYDSADKVTVQLLGDAAPGLPSGVVCASFNAAG